MLPFNWPPLTAPNPRFPFFVQQSPCDSHDFDPAPAHPVPGPDASWGQEVEQLRSLIEAAWVAGGDGEWAAQLVEQRAQQRAEAVRRALWPLLPREKQYTLGEVGHRCTDSAGACETGR